MKQVQFNVKSLLAKLIVMLTISMVGIGNSFAQTAWPNAQTIRFIVPFTPGSGTDVIARLIANKVADSLGTSIFIENKPGAGGTIGAALVAKSAPDGYTFLIQSSGHVVNPFIYSGLPYDTLKDFAAVTSLVQLPNVMVTSPNAGYTSVADLIAKAQANPGSKNYASAGNGSATHMNAEKFRIAAKINANHIPYKGTPDAITDTMAGRVDWFFSPIVSALPLIKDGKLQALAVGTSKRSIVLPNVPTTIESGAPNSSYIFWVGIFAPSKTPTKIINRMNAAIIKVMQEPAVVEQLHRLGAESMVMSPEKFDQMVKTEMDSAAILVKESKMVVN
ncbi:tripartite tricarboxylate transporter substrate binding protein [Polynucleobacter sp. JS-JIR-5-A7]|jgi:tripartite-type tricarboxylate transporter receptor subunit TctC|uniref:tripartite tricarboxylate transporter substrate binding protein n=1 Tax=Polynucleobacter sp. JS-JIR-5-A7 TaxID=1758395 RepID=UPI00203D838C|nr:tripartite tricarboxylate transporter substrate binding protein [Polynucleobacter sp. JS-JIR-5-A7]